MFKVTVAFRPYDINLCSCSQVLHWILFRVKPVAQIYYFAELFLEQRSVLFRPCMWKLYFDYKIRYLWYYFSRQVLPKESVLTHAIVNGFFFCHFARYIYIFFCIWSFKYVHIQALKINQSVSQKLTRVSTYVVYVVDDTKNIS